MGPVGITCIPNFILKWKITQRSGANLKQFDQLSDFGDQGAKYFKKHFSDFYSLLSFDISVMLFESIEPAQLCTGKKQNLASEY